MEAIDVLHRLPPRRKSISTGPKPCQKRLKYLLAMPLACLCLLLPNPVSSGLYEPLLIPLSEVACLATAMEKEALTEGKHGMRLVANVIVRRALLAGSPVCDVVRKPKQFSWATSSTRMHVKLKSTEEHAREILVNVALGKHVDKLKATHFTTNEAYERITWKLPVVLRYKNHTFMREDK